MAYDARHGAPQFYRMSHPGQVHTNTSYTSTGLHAPRASPPTVLEEFFTSVASADHYYLTCAPTSSKY